MWWLDTSNDIWDQEFGVEIFDIPRYGNDRLRSQRGRFTHLKAPYNRLETFVQQQDSPNALIKLLIPTVECNAAIAGLDFMGINYSTIFPGLEGAAKAASLKVFCEVQNRGVCPSSSSAAAV